MSTFQRDRIRIAIDCSKTDLMIDTITGASPDMWRGTDLQIEFACFFGDQLLSVGNYVSMTCEVKQLNHKASAALMRKDLANSDLNAALTLPDWQSGIAQHGVFAFTFDESRLDLQGLDQNTFWLVISAITTDSPPRKVTLGATTLLCKEDGAGEDTPAPPLGSPLYLTAAQTQALIGNPILPAGNPLGATIKLDSLSGQYSRIWGVDDTGARIDAIIQNF